MPIPAWNEIVATPEWKKLDAVSQGTVYKTYLKDMASVPEWKGLTPKDKFTVVRQMELDAGWTKPDEFKANNPNLYAAGMTLANLPTSLKEAGESVLSGVTLGVSDKIKEGAVKLSNMVTGGKATGKYESIVPGEDYEPVNQYVKTVADIAGSFAPIGAVAKGVGLLTKGAKFLSKSKYVEPAAKVAGWAGAGAAYDATRGMITEGKVPTGQDTANSAAMWGGIEGIMQTLGWGGRLTMGVNRLAKSWGISNKEALRVILDDAKANNLPISHYAKDYSRLQEHMAKMGEQADPLKVKIESAADDFVNRVEELSNKKAKQGKVGTYQDLTGDLKAEEAYRPIDAERAAQPKMFNGKVPDVERIDPELAKKTDEFMFRKYFPVKQKFGDRVPKEPEVVEESTQEVGESWPPKKNIPVSIEGMGIKDNTKSFKDGTQLFSAVPGATAGIETDENGNVVGFNEKTAALGMMAGLAGVKLHGKFKGEVGKTLSRDEIVALRNEARQSGKPFDEHLRSKGFTHKDIINVVTAIRQEGTKAAYDTLKGTLEVGELPKRIGRGVEGRGGINLERQDLSDQVKQAEAFLLETRPDKVITHKETMTRATELAQNPDAMLKIFNKVKMGSGLNQYESTAMRIANASHASQLEGIIEHAKPEEMNQLLEQFRDNILSKTADAGSMAGRVLNAQKIIVGPIEALKAAQKIRSNLSDAQWQKFQEMNKHGLFNDPYMVKQWLKTIDDPKVMDYVYEYWYNAILSGIPTHIVNVASNTMWQMFQIPHRALVGTLDMIGSKITGKQRETYVSEIIPMLAGYKTGFKTGREGAKEMIRTGELLQFESKWAREMGEMIGSFDRSPNSTLRKIAPAVTAPTRALRAMDVWANSMAFDAQTNALLHRLGMQKGLRGEKLESFVDDYLMNPDKIPQDIREGAAQFAKYSTFMDDPGKISDAISKLRNTGFDIEKFNIGEVKPLVFIVPFVQTIGNLMKRGIEMTPGVGLALSKGQRATEVIAKQIEGAILAAPVLYKVMQGEITGQVPKDAAEREAFYREGKMPWSVKLGDTWYQYRRIEPFNTAIAAAVNAYEQINKAKEGSSIIDISANLVDNFVTNILDSSYMQGLTNALDKYGKRQGMIERTAAGFIPYSGLLRSFDRAAEAVTEGKVGVRDNTTMKGSLAQVIPFWHGGRPIKVDVFGKEKLVEGNAFRQWLPYKMSEAKNDPVEKELARLKYFPSLPNKNAKISSLTLPIDEKEYNEFVIKTGKETKQYFDLAVHHPEYQAMTDVEKQKHLKSVYEDIKDTYSSPMKAKAFWRQYKSSTPETKKKMLDIVNNSEISDDLMDALEQYK
jgi:hypothetical protein